MEKLYGYSEQKKNIINAIKNGTLSHFYIISGEEGSGKKTFAKYITKAMMCESRHDLPCGRCKSCLMSENENNVDVTVIKGTNKKSVGTDDIKDSFNSIYVRPMTSNRKVFIIESGESLTIGAANKLLKVLEEPPSYGVILLLTSNKDLLLETIISRGININLLPLEEKVVRNYIKREHKLFDEKKIDFIVKYSNGNIGVAKKLINDEVFFEMRDEVAKVLLFFADDKSKCLSSIDGLFSSYPKRQDELLAIFLSISRDMVVYKNTNSLEQMINLDKEELIVSLSKKISGIYELYDGIIETIKFKNQNINAVLALKAAFISI